jgi:hypothetical protein
LGNSLTLCADQRGGLLIADRSNRCVRRAFPREGSWFVKTLAGHPHNRAKKDLQQLARDEGPIDTGARERLTDDGEGDGATFHYLHSNIIADPQGNAYLIDADYLRRISPDGQVETLNPNGGSGSPAEEREEPLQSARFRLIMAGGICFGPDGCIYVADRWNHCIRKVDLKNATVSIVVGPGDGYVDGPARSAGFHDSPGHIVFDPYRKRFYTCGVDDWGLRTYDGKTMQTIAGGGRQNSATHGPARQAGIHWGGVRGIDPREPHDIYFWSGHPQWRGRTGRLFLHEIDQEQP